MSRLLGVVALQPADSEAARQLAERLQLPLLDNEQGLFHAQDADRCALVLAPERLEIRSYGPRKFSSVAIENQQAEIQRRIRAGRKQAFARALGLHKTTDLHILDATAGLGRDALVMHGLGAGVSLLERSLVLHALLAHALKHRLEGDRGLQLLPCQDAGDYLRACKTRYDVIYLDPMYPKTRSTALPKKEMQLLRSLMGGDDDADALLGPALGCAARVVVKRAPHAAFLAGRDPHHSIKGNRVRYDVYFAGGVAGSTSPPP